MTALKMTCILVVLVLSSAGSALAASLSRGDILMSQPGVGRIVAVNPTTGLPIRVFSGGSLVRPMGIAVADSGRILVADAGAWDVSGDGKIIEIDPGTGDQWVISSGGSLDDPYGIAREESGNLVVTDGHYGFMTGEVLRIDRASGGQSVLSSGGNLINPDDITIGPDGHVYLADAGNNYGGIMKIDSSTGAQSWIVPRGGHDAVHGIAMDVSGRISFDDDDPSEIWTILPPGAKEKVSSGGYLNTGVRHVDLDLNGNVIVTDFTGSGGELLQIDPETGDQLQIMTWSGWDYSAWGVAVYPVPEPVTFSLLAISGLVMIRRRR